MVKSHSSGSYSFTPFFKLEFDVYIILIVRMLELNHNAAVSSTWIYCAYMRYIIIVLFASRFFSCSVMVVGIVFQFCMLVPVVLSAAVFHNFFFFGCQRFFFSSILLCV